MKKILSLAAAAVMAATTVIPAVVNAEDYSPTLYFKPISAENAGISLNGNEFYLNKNFMDGKDATIKFAEYISDERDYAKIVTVKWGSKNDKIKLTETIDPITIAGNSPYKDFNSPEDIIYGITEKNNSAYVNYHPGFTLEAMELNDPKTDKYPLSASVAVISADIEPGDYTIEYLADNTYFCDIVYRSPEGKVSQALPSGDYLKPLNIHVSDVLPGDTNGDKVVNGKDATLIFNTYVLLSADEPVSVDEEHIYASDVNRDGRSDGRDATLLLNYYAYLSSLKDDAKPIPVLEYVERLKKGEKL